MSGGVMRKKRDGTLMTAAEKKKLDAAEKVKKRALAKGVKHRKHDSVVFGSKVEDKFAASEDRVAITAAKVKSAIRGKKKKK